MMMFPQVQKTAQEHIDRVVGPDRLPTLEEVAELPYIRAVVKETIRWMPTIILGSPHANIQEDFYEGYRIPKASLIVPNVWSVASSLECLSLCMSANASKDYKYGSSTESSSSCF